MTRPSRPISRLKGKQLMTRPPLDRMNRIFQIIKAGKYPNRITLSTEIEVTTKTIQRDLDFMRDRLNLPIAYMDKQQGYAFTQPVESFPMVELSEAELIAKLMDHGVLCIQGPPGTGKTYTGSRVILALLQSGKRVGIMSNSHKAVINLLRATGKALGNPNDLRGVKIGGDSNDEIFAEFPNLRSVGTKEALSTYKATGGIVAGTAWPFSRPEWDGMLDYLIVDEAGQVSLANLVGVSLAAKTLILLGDQMQLEQPIQGTHPGETGRSALQYYLQDHATIPPELGVFLDRSFRMHPEVCQFISDTVYEGRLDSVPGTKLQKIELNEQNRLVRKSAGIQFIGVEHDGNVQCSEEEIDLAVAVFNELIGRPFQDSLGGKRMLTVEDFLFISPYNLQVNRMRAKLPADARVGSVDKFQGQEAPVTIFSLGSSFGEYGSRGLSFLLDRNRINVAISRAQCLAVVIGEPEEPHGSILVVRAFNSTGLFGLPLRPFEPLA